MNRMSTEHMIIAALVLYIVMNREGAPRNMERYKNLRQ